MKNGFHHFSFSRYLQFVLAFWSYRKTAWLERQGAINLIWSTTGPTDHSLIKNKKIILQNFGLLAFYLFTLYFHSIILSF